MATTPTSHRNEDPTPFLSSSSAISASPYAHHDAILRSNYLARRQRENMRFERDARRVSSHNSLVLFVWDGMSAISIFANMLFNWETTLGCSLTVGATLLAYLYVPNDDGEWNSRLPDILLSFAIITPLSQSITMGWNRREMALKALATYRSAVNNLYVAHAAWDWGECSKGRGRRGCEENGEDEADVYGRSAPTTTTGKKNIDWLNHSDATLCHLIHLSDSLFQYLTLPSATRARHRATAKGRKEANVVLSTGREIFTSTVCGRMSMLSQMCEALKYRGLPGNEASRIRNWENSITTAIEDLRNVKEYRTLQALRVYERLFCLFLPPFFATNYAQVAHDTNLFLGIATGVITSIALTGLFECVRTLEDPFVSNLTLDGIDVREELVVLAHQELLVSRKMWFPKAGDFVLTSDFLAGDDATDNARDIYRNNEDRLSRHFSPSLRTSDELSK
ncbi:hypothetical protein ACHAXA_006020 [Cyclostephanos tholiformis]|uniref:Uncharacterized protein n=1 Tax=Cyclostephanos tholiformis TaxID=382380 RepID=A0ABD3SQQ2_9STRA